LLLLFGKTQKNTEALPLSASLTAHYTSHIKTTSGFATSNLPVRQFNMAEIKRTSLNFFKAACAAACE
jgi:hypothetical protein